MVIFHNSMTDVNLLLYSLILLFKILVLSILEKGSVIWFPDLSNHINGLLHIQDRFIRLLRLRLGYIYRNLPVPLVSCQSSLVFQSFHLRPQHNRPYVVLCF